MLNFQLQNNLQLTLVADNPPAHGHALEVLDCSWAATTLVCTDNDVTGAAIEAAGQTTTKSPRKSLNITLHELIQV